MKEAVIRMETAARPTTDRSASPRLLKGLLLAITLVALLATTVILCQQDIENPSYVYMILDETGMQIIDGRPDGDRTTGLLDIRADNSSRDAQLLLVKGQQVQVADAQGATYLVTTRRETVDNLLRRSDVTVGDGEMVVVDTTGETPTVSVMAEYSQTRDVTVTKRRYRHSKGLYQITGHVSDPGLHYDRQRNTEESCTCQRNPWRCTCVKGRNPQIS